MTLYRIVQILKGIAASQPNIRTTTDGSVYDSLNNNPAIKYDVFHISQTTHREDENYDFYGFNLFYISRLEDSLEDNRLQIQSIGKEVLSNIIRTLCENFSIDYPDITYFPFTQRFNDLCAGVYCSIQLDVPKELWCADDYVAEVVPGSGIKLQNIGITITENGLRVITPGPGYDGIGEIRIETDVPQYPAVLQDKEVEYTANGSYTIHPDAGYDGLSSVAVDVLVPDNYDEGYDDGKRDGEAEQKAKLTVTSFTENNTYTRENGWSAVTVDVPSDYQDGYDDGVADQKAKLSTTSVTENGTYTREDGYSAITVNVPQGQGYEEGYEDGEAAQKAKLTVTSFTENNTYTREDGWSAVTVNVPSDYQDGYDDGYEDGYAAGASACSGLFITAITLNVDSAITDTATATTTFAPLTSITDIYYTSSNPSIAAIDQETGVITAVSNGSVTICTNDRWSNLKDCKSVSIAKSPAPATSISINVPSTITDSATATTTVNPLSASTNLQYSSSDTSKATINATTGAISVKASGTVQFCVTDTISGLQSCKNANVRKAATAITINVPSTVTDSATATTTVSPTGATTNLTYTSSNTSKATINSTTGVITVKESGSVQFCVKDSISNKQSCKTVTVVKSPVPATSITINVPTTVTDSATATTTVNPSSASTNLQYSSSDTSKATINATTGAITVISTGSVTFCVTDNISGLQSCKTVTLKLSEYYLRTPLTFEILTGGNIYFAATDSSFTPTIQYRKNNGSWTNITSSTGAGATISTTAGDIIQFKGCLSSTYIETGKYVFLSSYNQLTDTRGSARYNIYGNIMSLVACNETTYANIKTLPSNNTFELVFRRGGVISAENLRLPATDLRNSCYAYMFAGCQNLTTPPQLTATTLADYCYRGMFENCTSLTTAPELPATTLAIGCYYAMFEICTSLVKAPDLPALTLVDWCYHNLFTDCGSLNSIKCLATDISAFESLTYWVTNVSSTGTFIKNPTMTEWPIGGTFGEGIPEGWTIIDNT